MLAGVLVLFMLAAVGLGGMVAQAQGPSPAPTKAPGASAGAAQAPSGVTTLADLYWQALAKRLGTTVEKLQQTITDARQDSINQAVKEGLLTQSQADRMLENLKNTKPGTVFDNVRPNRTVPQTQTNFRATVLNAALEAAAKKLGLSTDDLQKELRTKTLLAVAKAKNVDATSLRTAIADAAKAAVDKLVKEGTLTQAQGDAIKANIKPENINLNARSLILPWGGGTGLDMTPRQRLDQFLNRSDQFFRMMPRGRMAR